MYQDASGRVGDDPALLTPPLVSVQSCEVQECFQAYQNVPTSHRSYIQASDASSRILARNAFRTGERHPGAVVSIRFAFIVSPPAHLASVEFEGGCGCVLKVEGAAKRSTEIELEGSGRFNVRRAEEVDAITMTLPAYKAERDDKKTYVRFIFGPPAPVITPVGLALRAHEQSMDCRLETADGGAIRFHRAVLAARSGYFDKLFFGEFKEAASDTVVVEGSALAWGCIKSMMYAQILGAKDRVVLTEALETVHRYELEAFASPVWDALSQALDGAAAVRALRVAGLHDNKAIGIDSMGFIQSNIATLICDCQWVRQYADALEEIGGVPQGFLQETS